jgi:glutamate formiminotransferase
VWLDQRGVAQVSINVEEHQGVPLKDVVAAVARRAEIAETELVGLAPRAALEGFPADVPVRNARTIDALDNPH